MYDTVEIDMGQISGWDVNSISNITGATLADNVLVFDPMAEEVTYTYDCGYNCIMTVHLYIRLNQYQITYKCGSKPGILLSASDSDGIAGTGKSGLYL